MKKIFAFLIFMNSVSSVANTTTIEMDLSKNSQKESINKKTKRSNTSFSYGLQYLGPSLDPNYEDGATYNLSLIHI